MFRFGEFISEILIDPVAIISAIVGGLAALVAWRIWRTSWLWTIPAVVIPYFIFVSPEIFDSLDRQPFGATHSNYSLSHNYLCEGEQVTISWQPNLARCVPELCHSPGAACVTTSDCPSANFTCIDETCRGNATPIPNPCPTPGTCTNPTVMRVTAEPADAFDNTTLISDSRQQSAAVALPQPNRAGRYRLFIDPDGPHPYFRPRFSNIVVSTADDSRQATGELVCNPDPASAASNPFKFRLIGGAATDRVALKQIQNRQRVGFLFLMPRGTSGITAVTLPANGTIGDTGAYLHTGNVENILVRETTIGAVNSLRYECRRAGDGTILEQAPWKADHSGLLRIRFDVLLGC